MDPSDTSANDPSRSPVGDREDIGQPTPRLSEPATEGTAQSVERERDAVGDAPDTGGLTPPDQAQ